MKKTRTSNWVKAAVGFTVSALMLTGCTESGAEALANALRSASAQESSSSVEVVKTISLTEAQAAALNELGVAEAEFVEKEHDPDDGVYELEFEAAGVEYDCEVDAVTGKVLKVEKEAERKETKPAEEKTVKTEQKAETKTETKTESKKETKTEPTSKPQKPAYITLAEAKAAALKAIGKSEAEFAKKEYDLDDGVYELEFEAAGVEYDCEVDAVTGKVLKVEKEAERKETKPAEEKKTVKTETKTEPKAEQKTEPTAKPAKPTYITLAEAKAAALKAIGKSEAEFAKKEHDLDDGVYELEFEAAGVEYDCEVDAVTGKVLKVEKEAERKETKPAEEKKTVKTEPKTEPKAEQKTEPTAKPAKPTYITLAEAKAAALKAIGKSEAEFAKKEHDLDDGVYELEFEAAGEEYDCEVDAVTGKVLKVEKEAEREETKPAEEKKTVKTEPKTEPKAEQKTEPTAKPQVIGLEAAKSKVFGALGLTEAEVRDAEYDLDDGVYELEFKANGMEYEYAVNAVTGEIVKAEKSRDD